jgi:hypothetical protein
MAAAAPLAQSATMLQAGKREARDAVDEELNVVGLERGIVFDRGEAMRDRELYLRGVVEDLVFHGQLDRVGELEAVGAEELDAVVAPGIVRGGDDDAGVEAVGARRGRRRPGGHDAPRFPRVAPAFAQAGGERGGDPGAGLARVAAEKDFGLRRFLRSEWPSARPTRRWCWVERGLAGDGANAVGAEEFACGWAVI